VPRSPYASLWERLVANTAADAVRKRLAPADKPKQP
jgi:hypothetical protein